MAAPVRGVRLYCLQIPLREWLMAVRWSLLLPREKALPVYTLISTALPVFHAAGTVSAVTMAWTMGLSTVILVSPPQLHAALVPHLTAGDQPENRPSSHTRREESRRCHQYGNRAWTSGTGQPARSTSPATASRYWAAQWTM